MAKPATSTTKQTATGLVELYKQEELLKEQLEEIRQKRLEATRRQAEEIRGEVVKKLQDVSNLIAPLIEDELWSWRSTGEFDGVLAELELQPREAKSIELNQEMAEIIVEFVKKQPHGCTIDQISAGILDGNNQPRWKTGTLRPQVPQIVKAGLMKQKPNPANGRQNLYFIES